MNKLKYSEVLPLVYYEIVGTTNDPKLRKGDVIIIIPKGTNEDYYSDTLVAITKTEIAKYNVQSLEPNQLVKEYIHPRAGGDLLYVDEVKSIMDFLCVGVIGYSNETFRYRRLVKPRGPLEIEATTQQLRMPQRWSNLESSTHSISTEMNLDVLLGSMRVMADPRSYLEDYNFFNQNFKVSEFVTEKTPRSMVLKRGFLFTTIAEVPLNGRNLPTGTVLRLLDPPMINALAQIPQTGFNVGDVWVAWSIGGESFMERVDSAPKGSFIKIEDLLNNNFPHINLDMTHRMHDNISDSIHVKDLVMGNYKGVDDGVIKVTFSLTNKRCEWIVTTPNNSTKKVPMKFTEDGHIDYKASDGEIRKVYEALLKAETNKDGLKKSGIFK